MVASLWQVNDSSTSQLMQQFYGNLAKGSDIITKTEALRQAQLRLLRGQASLPAHGDERGIAAVQARPGAATTAKQRPTEDFSHPYYWAPFILIGNGL